MKHSSLLYSDAEAFYLALEILIFSIVYHGNSLRMIPEKHGGPDRTGQEGTGPEQENQAGFVIARGTEHDVATGSMSGCLGDVPGEPQRIDIGQYRLEKQPENEYGSGDCDNSRMDIALFEELPGGKQ